jgi:hypothetical protein
MQDFMNDVNGIYNVSNEAINLQLMIQKPNQKKNATFQ